MKQKKLNCVTKKLLSALSLTTNYIVLNRKATKEQSRWEKNCISSCLNQMKKNYSPVNLGSELLFLCNSKLVYSDSRKKKDSYCGSHLSAPLVATD